MKASICEDRVVNDLQHSLAETGTVAGVGGSWLRSSCGGEEFTCIDFPFQKGSPGLCRAETPPPLGGLTIPQATLGDGAAVGFKSYYKPGGGGGGAHLKES